MLTLCHAPMSRSTRITTLIDELGADVEIRTVTIPRRDGSGGRDPSNPHPEGKVPLLVHDGAVIWESSAIILYLTDQFPAASLGPLPGDPLRGPYLSWLAYYGGVVEPVMVFEKVLKLDHPVLAPRHGRDHRPPRPRPRARHVLPGRALHRRRPAAALALRLAPRRDPTCRQSATGWSAAWTGRRRGARRPATRRRSPPDPLARGGAHPSLAA